MLSDRAMLGDITVNIYLNFSKYHKYTQAGVSRSDDTDRQRQIDRISELPTDRHSLDLSESCLYMVHFGLGPFFRKSQKMVT